MRRKAAAKTEAAGLADAVKVQSNGKQGEHQFAGGQRWLALQISMCICENASMLAKMRVYVQLWVAHFSAGIRAAKLELLSGDDTAT